MSNTQRLTGLDGLRAIAALGVLMHHFTEHAAKLSPAHFFAHPVPGITGVLWPFHIGSHGVTLFFVISGFVILSSLNRCRSGSDFAFGRFSRLYPLFWFAVVVTAAFRTWMGHEQIPMRTLLANLTMMPTLWKEPMIDGVYWTLMVELKFYLLAYLVWRLNGLSRIEHVALAWLGTTVGVQLLIHAGVAPALTQWAHEWLILSHAPLFTCGIMLFRMHHAGTSTLRWAVLLGSLCLVAAGGGILKGGIALVSCWLIRRVCIGSAPHWMSSSTLVYLGGASYAIYLLHSIIGWHIGQALFASGWHVAPATLTSALGCLCLALGAHHVVENPTQRWLRRWWQNQRLAHGSA
jgi:peptidoglycan/LPS O-acetylase OafA/YrhL